MAKTKWAKLTHTGVKKSSSQGIGGRGRKVKISGYKKAIITLKKGQSIDLTTGI